MREVIDTCFSTYLVVLRVSTVMLHDVDPENKQISR